MKNCNLPENPKENDFVLIEFKNHVYYVAKLLSAEDDDGDLEVSYLRMSIKMTDSFIFPHVEDKSSVGFELIRAKFPNPTNGSTQRLSKCLKFLFNMT